MKIPAPLAATPGADPGILPLINIVFLLLAFLMLAGALVAADAFGVRPPQAQGIAAADQAGLLALAADGRLALDGTPLAREDLLPLAQRWQAAHPGARLHLKADAAADTAQVVAVLETLRAAGLNKVQLLTVGAP